MAEDLLFWCSPSVSVLCVRAQEAKQGITGERVALLLLMLPVLHCLQASLVITRDCLDRLDPSSSGLRAPCERLGGGPAAAWVLHLLRVHSRPDENQRRSDNKHCGV